MAVMVLLGRIVKARAMLLGVIDGLTHSKDGVPEVYYLTAGNVRIRRCDALSAVELRKPNTV
jgi:hypothetical protein